MTGRCPDPACGGPLHEDRWFVEQMSEPHSWDPDSAHATYSWHQPCVTCDRVVFALLVVDREDPTPVEPDPHEWCCPLCGALAKVKAFKPVVAARCIGGCGSLIGLRRGCPARCECLVCRTAAGRVTA